MDNPYFEEFRHFQHMVVMHFFDWYSLDPIEPFPLTILSSSNKSSFLFSLLLKRLELGSEIFSKKLSTILVQNIWRWLGKYTTYSKLQHRWACMGVLTPKIDKFIWIAILSNWVKSKIENQFTNGSSRFTDHAAVSQKPRNHWLERVVQQYNECSFSRLIPELSTSRLYSPMPRHNLILIYRFLEVLTFWLINVNPQVSHLCRPIYSTICLHTVTWSLVAYGQRFNWRE